VIPEGSIHGRFQPFHRGHLEYALAAASRCSFLWVGITQIVVASLLPDAQMPRSRPSSNPYTYWQRHSMVERSLYEAGLDRNRFRIVPFPIEHPEDLTEFIPIQVPAFTTVYEDWNRKKVDTLERAGYEVIVLWERTEKLYTGGEVRRLIQDGDPRWREQVPAGTASVLDSMSGDARGDSQGNAPSDGLSNVD
jgi:nicotinamide mononucleotide adenylyltransferase